MTKLKLRKLNDIMREETECQEKRVERFRKIFDDLFMTDNYVDLITLQEYLYLHPFAEKALEELRELVRGFGSNYHVIPRVSCGVFYVTFARPPSPHP